MKQPATNVILFDGVCNLCNSSINLIIDNDRAKRFSFASLQSEAARQLLQKYNLDHSKLDSVMLVTPDNCYQKSTAALEIARRMNFPWPLFYVFRLVPAGLLDIAYNFVARNRYKWFGKRQQCRMPEPGIVNRFLDYPAA